MTLEDKPTRFPIAVLISGTGSNLKAIIDASHSGLAIDIQVVISNRPDAQGLKHAENAGIPSHVIDHTTFDNAAAFDAAISRTLQRYPVKLIVLAGFMRILGKDFVLRYPGEIINLHPSLLPKYRGLHTFRRALAAGDHYHGSSIHLVTPTLDSGPIVAQAQFSIQPDDTESTLQAKTQSLEHIIMPYILDLFSVNRIQIKDRIIHLDRQPLPYTGINLTPIIINL